MIGRVRDISISSEPATSVAVDGSARTAQLPRQASSEPETLVPGGLGVSDVLLPGLTSRARDARARGFTLVEMLVVIVIIGILASLALAALVASQESARRARTEGLIAVLNSQIAVRWESYRTRRLPVNATFFDPADNLQQIAFKQLIARRQLMRIELPDRWWDIAFDDSDTSATSIWQPNVPVSERVSIAPVASAVAYTGEFGPANSKGPEVRRNTGAIPWNTLLDRKGIDLISRTSLAYSYQRRYHQALQNTGKRPTNQHQGAECLYMILTTNMGDESTGGGIFNDRDIADVDEDGMPELVDGWGNPISFLRWAPAFRSDMQSGDPINDHDPFDPRKVDKLAFRIFPLISSAGPDGVLDDGTGLYKVQGVENHGIDPFAGSDIYPNLNDPYAPRSEAGWPDNVIFRGQRLEEEAGAGPNDNVFNQALQVR